MRDILDYLGIVNTRIHYGLSVPRLVQATVAKKEGILAPNGALVVATGKYTGRSPDDKFVVDTPDVHELIDWDNNKAMSVADFGSLYDKVCAYLQNREVYVRDGFAGADPDHRLSVRFVNEFAWQNLFEHQMFIRPTTEQLEGFAPDFHVICAPGFEAVPARDATNSEAAVVINFEKRIVLIMGTEYAGEVKKSIFTVMNYLMVLKNIASMHCSANVGEDGDVALFFGLSGTGKTSLSADPDRYIIGDDEHGWTDTGIFNYEGGCYAKCIDLSRENEPLIWDAIRFGTVLENVDYEPVTYELDYASDRLTENTRAAYPIDHLPKVDLTGRGTHPKNIFFLTADAFGVMPPIARLDSEGLMYHFLSGYTSKLAGTERGITEPQATFSACFGAPFLPLHPLRYAELLAMRAAKHGANCYLLNTGWSGGQFGVGRRIAIEHTRAMISAALDGTLDKVGYSLDPIFRLMVPDECPDVPTEILRPQQTWADKDAFFTTAKRLAKMFGDNFAAFSGMPDSVKAAGPVSE